jgi:hypothetical protein
MRQKNKQITIQDILISGLTTPQILVMMWGALIFITFALDGSAGAGLILWTIFVGIMFCVKNVMEAKQNDNK